MVKNLYVLDSEYFSTFVDRFKAYLYYYEAMKMTREMGGQFKFNCINFFYGKNYNESQFSLSIFLLQVTFLDKTNIEKLSTLRCDDNVCFLEALYNMIIEQFSATKTLRMIVDSIPSLSQPSTDHYPDPPVHIFLLNKDQQCECFLTLYSQSEIDKNCFNVVPAGEYYGNFAVHKLIEIEIKIKSLKHDDKLIQSLRAHRLEEHCQVGDNRYVFYLLTCRRGGKRYTTGFVLEAKQDQHTMLISKTFSNWKIMLAKSYKEMPTQLDMWQDYEKRHAIDILSVIALPGLL